MARNANTRHRRTGGQRQRSHGNLRSAPERQRSIRPPSADLMDGIAGSESMAAVLSQHPGDQIVDVRSVHGSPDFRDLRGDRCPKKRGDAPPIRAAAGLDYLRRTARTPLICPTTLST
jgi:hypothetical protein